MKTLTKQEVLSLRKELNKVLEKFNKTSDIKIEIQDAKYVIDIEFTLINTKIDKNGNKQTKISKHLHHYTE